MLWFKKKKKKEEKKETETVTEEIADRPQTAENGYLRGMYCEACGYMEVNEESSALPLEGFAMCPNCGAPLKAGWFRKDELGYHLAENAQELISVQTEEKKKKKLTGGHHRVRPAGPAIQHHKVSHHR